METQTHSHVFLLAQIPLFDKEEECYNIVDISCPIKADIINESLKSDTILQSVYNFVSIGCPEQQDDPEIQPYFSRRFSLTINHKLLCLHSEVNQIIIPRKLRSKNLILLHDGHWGIVLARQHIWWPGIDDDIAQLRVAPFAR